MPRYICKLQDGDTAYYMEWSTVVDAPVTFGMTLEEFMEHYREEYGKRGLMEMEASGWGGSRPRVSVPMCMTPLMN